MDNLGDWLYIVLLVIAGASSLFSSGKKKKRSSKPSVPPQGDFIPEEETPSSGNFWELFDEQPAQPARRTAPPAPASSPMPVPSRSSRAKNTSQPADRQKKKKKTAPLSSSASSPFLKGENHFSNRVPEQSPLRIERVEEEPGVMPENTFSDVSELRRAIICAEILNRKYP